MDMDDFQKQALKSVALTTKDIAALAHRALGLSGEAGVVANQVKKVIRDKNGRADKEDIALIRKRLGDVLYYTAVLAEYFDLTLTEIANRNVAQSAEFRKNRQQK